MNLIELICRTCGGKYYLFPESNLAADSGCCPRCDDEIAFLNKLYATKAPAKQPKQANEWGVFLCVMSALTVCAGLFALVDYLRGQL